MIPPLQPQPPDRSTVTHLIEAEACLRRAGRLLEYVGVVEPEYARVAGWAFRLAQRIAVDGGRLERAA